MKRCILLARRIRADVKGEAGDSGEPHTALPSAPQQRRKAGWWWARSLPSGAWQALMRKVDGHMPETCQNSVHRNGLPELKLAVAMLPHRCLGRASGMNTTSKGKSLDHVDQAQGPRTPGPSRTRQELSAPQRKPGAWAGACQQSEKAGGVRGQDRPARWPRGASARRRQLPGRAGTVPAGSTLARAGRGDCASHSANTPEGLCSQAWRWAAVGGSRLIALGRLTPRQQLRTE